MTSMTPLEHYEAAEGCMEQANQKESVSELFLAEAQVHATLALAGFTLVTGENRPAQRLWDHLANSNGRTA